MTRAIRAVLAVGLVANALAVGVMAGLPEPGSAVFVVVLLGGTLLLCRAARLKGRVSWIGTRLLVFYVFIKVIAWEQHHFNLDPAVVQAPPSVEVDDHPPVSAGVDVFTIASTVLGILSGFVAIADLRRFVRGRPPASARARGRLLTDDLPEEEEPPPEERPAPSLESLDEELSQVPPPATGRVLESLDVPSVRPADSPETPAAAASEREPPEPEPEPELRVSRRRPDRRLFE
jgi:hypothetical protein